MLKKIAVVLAGVAMLAVAACANAPTLTPAQIATALCVPANQTILTVNTFAANNPSDVNAALAVVALKKVQPTITAACTAIPTVTADNVQDLITTGLPALGTIVGMLPLPPATMNQIQDGFLAAELVAGLADVVVTNIKAAQTNPTSAKASVMKMALTPAK